MAARPRVTNNSVASLDEQSAVLDEIFDKDPNKPKDKTKSVKRKSTKSSAKPDKKKIKLAHKLPVAAAAALGAPPVQPADSLSQQDFEASDLDTELVDAESLTWSQAQREDLENMEDQSVEWVDDDSQMLDYPQHVPDHDMSDAESGSVMSVPQSVTVNEQQVLQEITAKGALADFLREQLAEVKECDKVTPKLSGGVARIVDKYLKDSLYSAEMEKLAKKYPKVENVQRMQVPKLDTEVFTLIQQNYRNMDQSVQGIQKGVAASMAALSPVLETIMIKSEDDPQLAELGINIADSLKLMAFTLNLLSGRRRELLKPCLAPAYVRVLTKGHETTPEWLFGGDLLTTTKKCEAAKRIGQKVLKPKDPPVQIRGKRDNQRRFRSPSPAQQQVLRPQIPQQQYQHGRFPNPQTFNQSYPYQPLEVGVPSGFPRPYRPRYQNQFQQGNQQPQQGQNFPKKVK